MGGWTVSRILALNPRAAITEVAVFATDGESRRGEVCHDRDELAALASVSAQLAPRLHAVEEWLLKWVDPEGTSAFDAVVGPVGYPGALPSGTYLLDETLFARLTESEQGDYGKKLGVPLAAAIARARGTPAFAVAPVSGEELDPLARISGVPELRFGNMQHHQHFNVRELMRMTADELGRPVAALSAVAAHLGRVFTICSCKGGRVLDISTSTERGPFSPMNSGALPVAAVARMAYSGMWSRDALLDALALEGGARSYAGSENLSEIAARGAQGDVFAILLLRAMSYQVAQEVAAQAVALRGRVDAVVLTGGCLRESAFLDPLAERLSWIAETLLPYPDEDELSLMARSVGRVLNGEMEADSPPQ